MGTLQNTCSDPRIAAAAEKHSQALHKESAKREFFVKTRADKCIKNSENCKLEISPDILELAQIAAKPCLFRQLHGYKNNCGQPHAIINLRIQLAGRFNPMLTNVSPRNRINPHANPMSSIFPIPSNTNPVCKLTGTRTKKPTAMSRRNVTATSTTMSIK